MGRYLVPAAMVSGIVALAVAALTIAAVPEHPGWWQGAIWLAVLGGITPLIHGVNIRIVPVFARRRWASLQWLRAQAICAIAGGWLAFGGRLADATAAERTGHVLALAGGILFTINIVRLFRQDPGPQSGAPLPYPGQADVDRIAISFTRVSGMYMLLGLTVGAVTSFWVPGRGRWELVWAHAMLAGFFLSMASGVGYHVLSRWTGAHWRSLGAIRLHALSTALALPAMLLALALDWDQLFLVAGPLQALSFTLLLVNTVPLAIRLPGISRLAWPAAAASLLVGVALGAMFAIDPAAGARLRLTHAELNLFGWTGLLVSAVAYYLVPRFAGSPLRWPRLATGQVAALITGIAAGATMLAFRGYGHDPGALLWLAQGMVAGSLLLCGTIVATTFAGRPGVAVAVPPPRHASRPLPMTPP